jgi:hypothetical protein
LLGRLECSLPVEFLGVGAGSAPEDRGALGRDVAAGTRTALLVCGDGTARRDEKAPGHFCPDSAAFDARVAELSAAEPYGVHYVVATRLPAGLA